MISSPLVDFEKTESIGFLPSDASNSRFLFIELASKWIFIHLSAASSLVNERGTRFIGSKDSKNGFNERCSSRCIASN